MTSTVYCTMLQWEGKSIPHMAALHIHDARDMLLCKEIMKAGRLGYDRLDVKDCTGRTPLFMAILNHRQEVASLLIQEKCNPNCQVHHA